MASVLSCFMGVTAFTAHTPSNRHLLHQVQCYHGARQSSFFFGFCFGFLVCCTGLERLLWQVVVRKPHWSRTESSRQCTRLFSVSSSSSSSGSRSNENMVQKDAFKTTVELDRLIDTLRETEYEKLPQVVAENVLAFDTSFWLRLAARVDFCNSPDDQKEYEQLASTVMTIVQRLVLKTQEKIESSTDVLKSILIPLFESSGEITWPPRDQQILLKMEKEIDRMEREGFLDESFLSEVSAQLRQATVDGDKPGLVAILQKVLQSYAATVLSRRSYAVLDGKIDMAEQLLEAVIAAASEEHWGEILRARLVCGGGDVAQDELVRVVEKRVERTLMRTDNGSYQQRLLVEYLREIETRADMVLQAFQNLSP